MNLRPSLPFSPWDSYEVVQYRKCASRLTESGDTVLIPPRTSKCFSQPTQGRASDLEDLRLTFRHS